MRMRKSRDWWAILEVAAICCTSVLLQSCALVWTHRPKEIIDPNVPEIVLTFRFVDVERGDPIQPRLVWIIYERFHGRITEMLGKQGHDALFLTQFMDDSTMRLPHYVPVPGEDEESYRYYIRVRILTADSMESEVYFVKNGKITGPASRDGRSEFPIPMDGHVRIEVPFRPMYSYPDGDVRASERLLDTLKHLSAMTGETVTKLSSRDVERLAGWMLSCLDSTQARLGVRGEITRLREHWRSIATMPSPEFRPLDR